MQTKFSTKSVKIYTQGGKTAGFVQGDVFTKKVEPKHFLQKPPALACDVAALDQAERAGATRIRFKVTDGRIYATSIEHFRRCGFELNRGFGRQIALALVNFARWTPPPVEQLSLWSAI